MSYTMFFTTSCETFLQYLIRRLIEVTNVRARAHYMPSNFTIVFRRALAFAPMWMSEYLFLLPKKDMRFLRSSRALVHELGKSLLVREKQMYDAGQVREGGSNVMSIFSGLAYP